LVGQDIKIIAGSSTTPTPGNDLFTGTAGNDTLDGGAGNDILNGLAGDDSLIGGTGLDQLDGGPGRDILEGGTQKDIFMFSALADSPRGVDRDVITDFSSAQNDKIDVSAIDANLVLGGDQAFAPVDPANLGAAFTGSAGQMRFDAATHTAQFDQDGDGVADMEIEVVGVASMSVGDFVL
jgi:serralysin